MFYQYIVNNNELVYFELILSVYYEEIDNQMELDDKYLLDILIQEINDIMLYFKN